jgi:hypothetical protein
VSVSCIASFFFAVLVSLALEPAKMRIAACCDDFTYTESERKESALRNEGESPSQAAAVNRAQVNAVEGNRAVIDSL